MREESEAKGFVLLSVATAGIGGFGPDRVISSRDVVPVVRIKCTR